MSRDSKGVSTVDLEKIRKEIKVNANDIYKTLKNFDAITDEYKDCFIDDIGIPYLKKYEAISGNFNTIYENMISISDEVTRLNYKYSILEEEIKAKTTSLIDKTGL